MLFVRCRPVGLAEGTFAESVPDRLFENSPVHGNQLSIVCRVLKFAPIPPGSGGSCLSLCDRFAQDLVHPGSAPGRFLPAEAEGVSLLRAQTVRGSEVPKRSPLSMTDWA